MQSVTGTVNQRAGAGLPPLQLAYPVPCLFVVSVRVDGLYVRLPALTFCYLPHSSRLRFDPAEVDVVLSRRTVTEKAPCCLLLLPSTWPVLVPPRNGFSFFGLPELCAIHSLAPSIMRLSLKESALSSSKSRYSSGRHVSCRNLLHHGALFWPCEETSFPLSTTGKWPLP